MPDTRRDPGASEVAPASPEEQAPPPDEEAPRPPDEEAPRLPDQLDGALRKAKVRKDPRAPPPERLARLAKGRARREERLARKSKSAFLTSASKIFLPGLGIRSLSKRITPETSGIPNAAEDSPERGSPGSGSPGSGGSSPERAPSPSRPNFAGGVMDANVLYGHANEKASQLKTFITNLFTEGDDEPSWSVTLKVLVMHGLIFAYLAVGAVCLSAIELPSEKRGIEAWKDDDLQVTNAVFGTESGACVSATPATSLACAAAMDKYVSHQASPIKAKVECLNTGCPEPYKYSFWHCWYAIFMTITTIGYGDITPVTSEGRAFMCLYSLVGIVLNGYTLTRMSVLVNRMASYFNDLIDLPFFSEQYENVWLLSIVGCAHIAAYSIIVMHSEAWDLDESIYFCWISFTTIGYGDYSPTIRGGGLFVNFAGYIILITVMTMVGLSLLASLLGAIADAASMSINDYLEDLAEDMGVKDDSSDSEAEEEGASSKKEGASSKKLGKSSTKKLVKKAPPATLDPMLPPLENKPKLPPVPPYVPGADGLPTGSALRIIEHANTLPRGSEGALTPRHIGSPAAPAPQFERTHSQIVTRSNMEYRPPELK